MLDVDHEAAAIGAAFVENQVHDRLEGAERLAAPADEKPKVVARHVDHHRLIGLLDRDLGGDAHLVEQLGHDIPSLDGVGLAQGDANASLLRGLLEHLDFDVVTRFVEVFEGLLDGLVDRLSRDFDAVAAAHAAFPLRKTGGTRSDPQPVMKYCWPMLNRLLTTQ